MSEHKPARNRLAIEANHFGLDADTAARLATRAESMGLLSDQIPEIDAVVELERMRGELEELADEAQKRRRYSIAKVLREIATDSPRSGREQRSRGQNSE